MRELPGNSNISYYSCEDLECVDGAGDDILDGEQCKEYLIDFGTKVDGEMIGQDAAAYLEGMQTSRLNKQICIRIFYL